MPTWLKVSLHIVAYSIVLLIGVAIGSAGSPAPTSAPATTLFRTPPSTATAPTADAKQQALDKLYADTQKRGSLAHLTEGQLKTAMDTFVCLHVDDLMALSQGGGGISGSDAGYLWGVNSVVGYC